MKRRRWNTIGLSPRCRGMYPVSHYQSPFWRDLYPVKPEDSVCNTITNGGRWNKLVNSVDLIDKVGDETRDYVKDYLIKNDGIGGFVKLSQTLTLTKWAVAFRIEGYVKELYNFVIGGIVNRNILLNSSNYLAIRSEDSVYYKFDGSLNSQQVIVANGDVNILMYSDGTNIHAYYKGEYKGYITPYNTKLLILYLINGYYSTYFPKGYHYDYRLWDLTNKTAQEINDYFSVNGCKFDNDSMIEDSNFPYHRWLMLNKKDVTAVFDSGSAEPKIHGTLHYDDANVVSNIPRDIGRYDGKILNDANKRGWNRAITFTKNAYKNGLTINDIIPSLSNKEYTILATIISTDNVGSIVSGGNGNNNGLRFFMNSPSYDLFLWPNPNSGLAYIGLTKGKMYRVGGRININDNTTSLWVDGVKVKEITYTTSDLTIPTTMTIGSEHIGNAFDGSIWNILMYNRALTDQEILDYNNNIYSENGLIGKWGFNGSLTNEVTGIDAVAEKETIYDFNKIIIPNSLTEPNKDIFGRDSLYKGRIKLNSKIIGGKVLKIATKYAEGLILKDIDHYGDLDYLELYFYPLDGNRSFLMSFNNTGQLKMYIDGNLLSSSALLNPLNGVKTKEWNKITIEKQNSTNAYLLTLNDIHTAIFSSGSSPIMTVLLLQYYSEYFMGYLSYTRVSFLSNSTRVEGEYYFNGHFLDSYTGKNPFIKFKPNKFEFVNPNIEIPKSEDFLLKKIYNAKWSDNLVEDYLQECFDGATIIHDHRKGFIDFTCVSGTYSFLAIKLNSDIFKPDYNLAFEDVSFRIKFKVTISGWNGDFLQVGIGNKTGCSLALNSYTDFNVTDGTFYKDIIVSSGYPTQAFEIALGIRPRNSQVSAHLIFEDIEVYAKYNYEINVVNPRFAITPNYKIQKNRLVDKSINFLLGESSLRKDFVVVSSIYRINSSEWQANGNWKFSAYRLYYYDTSGADPLPISEAVYLEFTPVIGKRYIVDIPGVFKNSTSYAKMGGVLIELGKPFIAVTTEKLSLFTNINRMVVTSAMISEERTYIKNSSDCIDLNLLNISFDIYIVDNDWINFGSTSSEWQGFQDAVDSVSNVKIGDKFLLTFEFHLVSGTPINHFIGLMTGAVGSAGSNLVKPYEGYNEHILIVNNTDNAKRIASQQNSPMQAAIRNARLCKIVEEVPEIGYLPSLFFNLLCYVGNPYNLPEYWTADVYNMGFINYENPNIHSVEFITYVNEHPEVIVEKGKYYTFYEKACDDTLMDIVFYPNQRTDNEQININSKSGCPTYNGLP